MIDTKHTARTLLTLGLYGCADRLFYRPSAVFDAIPGDCDHDHEDIYFRSADGTRLHAWFLPASVPARGIVLHFHGNSHNISAHYSYVSWLRNDGYHLFMFDYRGYGRSQGRPSRRGIHLDCLAALEYVCGRPEVGGSKIAVFGQSLGGALAIAALACAGDGRVGGLIVESTFASYRAIAREQARSMLCGRLLARCTRLLVTGGYDPETHIGRLGSIPILLVHGTADTLVPIEHSRRLVAQALAPVEMLTLDNAAHMEPFGRYLPLTRPRVLDFLHRCL